MTKFCPNCGVEINLENGFCPNCGTNINQDNNGNNNIQNNQPTAQPQKDDNIVIIGFALSILGFVCCNILAIPGLIINIISLQNINKGTLPSDKKNFAIAGIAVSAIGILAMLIKFIDILISV